MLLKGRRGRRREEEEENDEDAEITFEEKVELVLLWQQMKDILSKEE